MGEPSNKRIKLQGALDLPSSGPSAGFSSTSMLPSQPIPGPAAGPSTSKNETSSTRNHSGKKYAGSRRDRDEQDDDPPSEPRNFDQVRFGDYVVQTWFYSPYPLPLTNQPQPVNQASQPTSDQAIPSLTLNKKEFPPPPPFPPPRSHSRSRPRPTNGGTPTGRFNGNQHTRKTFQRDVTGVNASGEGGNDGRNSGGQRSGSRSGERGGMGRRKSKDESVSIQQGFVPLSNEDRRMQPPTDPTKAISTSTNLNQIQSNSVPALKNKKEPTTSSPTLRSLWVCDRCFKYMRDLKTYLGHVARCDLQQPPGRKVYQKGTYCIWEVEGSKEKLYCQNLSLFGKLFIDHKTLFFDMDAYLFYVLTEAMPKRDHAMAYFCKERVSYEDNNLACIVTFPMFQGQGFGRLLTEFSYYLTRGEASPGSPERPLSDLGAKGYEGYWVRTLLRALLTLIIATTRTTKSKGKDEDEMQVDEKEDGGEIELMGPGQDKDGLGDERKRLRKVWERKRLDGGLISMKDFLDKSGFLPDILLSKSLTLASLSTFAHLKQDDVVYALSRIGFDQLKRSTVVSNGDNASADIAQGGDEEDDEEQDEIGQNWKDVELVISLESVLRACEHWKVRGKGVLDENCCLV